MSAAERERDAKEPIAPSVRMRNMWKAFGLVVSDAGAELTAYPGEVLALVGENGAGKSTLMRLLAGLTRPDAGTMEVLGRTVAAWTIKEAISAGVGMVHQHFKLVPTLTVAENLVLGREPRQGLHIDLEQARADVEALVRDTGLAVPPLERVADLPVGVAQRVEILKALYRGARVLILDEPTAVLSPPEIQDLFAVLTTLKQKGTTVILITHKLDEVMAVSDRVTVMRRGKTVKTFLTRETKPEEIALAMVGREVVLPGHDGATVREIRRDGEPALRVEGLRVKSDRGLVAIDGLSFAIAPGEILGIAGVEGNGQTELVEAIAGLRPVLAGRVSLAGRSFDGASVRAREAAGLAHIPEDRQRRGLLLASSVAENLILGRQARYTRWGLLDAKKIAAFSAAQIAELDIRPPDAGAAVGTLSGGNQQKVVIARELSHGFSVLLAAQPTRGVDVGAIELIHARLRKARDEGKAVLLVSAELSEVLALSDRVAVLYKGKLVIEVPRAEASAARLGPYMTGVHAASEEARA